MKNVIAKIEELKAVENRTAMQSVYLANAVHKIENKSMSKVYRSVCENEYAVEIYGSKTLPTFKVFCGAMKQNETGLYSVYAGFMALKRLRANTAIGKKEAAAAKVKRQNKKNAAK